MDFGSGKAGAAARQPIMFWRAEAMLSLSLSCLHKPRMLSADLKVAVLRKRKRKRGLHTPKQRSFDRRDARATSKNSLLLRRLGTTDIH